MVKRRRIKKEIEFSYFLLLSDNLKFKILSTLWPQSYETIKHLCNFKNKEIRRFLNNYPSPKRGGVLGELLQLSNPCLREMNFPFISYLVLKYPDKPWDWFGLSMNPSISWEVVQVNLDKPWNYDKLSCNSSISWEVVQANPDEPWNWYYLSVNPSMTWEIVQNNPDKPWNWYGLSMNPSITWEIVQANSDKPWHWYYLSNKKDVFIYFF